MSLYELILNNILYYKYENKTAYAVKIATPYFVLKDEANHFKPQVKLDKLLLDVKYHEGKFTRFNLVYKTERMMRPYVVNLLVHYDLIEIYKYDSLVVKANQSNYKLKVALPECRQISMDELEEDFAMEGLINQNLDYELRLIK